MWLLAVLDACLDLSQSRQLCSKWARADGVVAGTHVSVGVGGERAGAQPVPGPRRRVHYYTHAHTQRHAHTAAGTRWPPRAVATLRASTHWQLADVTINRERETMLPPTRSLRVIILSRPKILRVTRLRESIVLFCMKVVATAARVVQAVHRRRGDRSDRLFFLIILIAMYVTNQLCLWNRLISSVYSVNKNNKAE